MRSSLLSVVLAGLLVMPLVAVRADPLQLAQTDGQNRRNDRRDDRQNNRQDRQDGRQDNRKERQDRRQGNDSDKTDQKDTGTTTK